MKLLLISPPFGEKGQKSKGLPIAPPVLEYLTGLTNQVRPDIEVELVDANKETFDPDTADADLIGFTVLTGAIAVGGVARLVDALSVRPSAGASFGKTHTRRRIRNRPHA